MSLRSSVDARRLDQQIRIERAAHGRDALGGPTKAWALRVACYAAVDATPVRKLEPLAGDQQRQVSDVTFWIRADVVERFGVAMTDRVTWKGRHYDIKDMPDQQLRGRLAALIANTGLNQG